ncbi:hypothetical protein MKL09_30860 [Methylobacterium sp. J-048]|uniref:hypothetical protein n=1 Tax=Methylobacterium sp. J-048 TaxID=2836635 RepID=UPI001FBA18F8|nr:hypothetical protein [Methylobacterium sp. J-048]MCJ2060910.1 hypothetical protein [Methylobacterium sp. J-048]
MRTYIFRAIRRGPDGMLGPDLYRRAFAAADDAGAVAAAKRIDLDLAELGANAVYVSAEDGRAIWSLHAQDFPDPTL